MKLRELADILGVEKYPEAFEKIYESLPDDDGALYDLDFIAGLEEKYLLFDNYYDLIVEAAKALPKDENRLAWARIVHSFNQNATTLAEMAEATFPETDGTLLGDLMPMLVFLPDVPKMAAIYAARGFNEEQIKKNLEIFKIDLRVLELTLGRPQLTKGHYNWTLRYMLGLIFDHGAFNFEKAAWGSKAILLKNKNSGAFVSVMKAGRFHECGLVFGSAGAEDEERAYDAEFVETDDAYIGHAVSDGRAERTPTVFNKSEWECVLSEGDDVISLHIPRNANIDPEYVTRSLREGFELAKKHYPEISPKFIICASWLLDKDIVRIIGEDKKLSHFINRFLMIPMKTSGREGLSYVFPGCHGAVEDYPENTTLQRGVKRLMLGGGSLHASLGVITEIK